MLLQKSATFILSPQVNSSSQPGHGQRVQLCPQNFLLFFLLHFLKQNQQNKKHRIKSTVAAASLLFSQSNCPASAWEWTLRGCSSLLAKISFIPCSYWFWLCSRQHSMEKEREFSVGSSLRLLSGVKSSSWGRLFIPVLRENQAPKPGGGTLGLHGLWSSRKACCARREQGQLVNPASFGRPYLPKPFYADLSPGTCNPLFSCPPHGAAIRIK